MMRKAALCARVAEWDTSSGRRLAKVRSFPHTRQWEVTAFVGERVAVDAGHKPALDALLLAVGNGKIDVVVCTALGRLTAAPQELMVLMQEFATHEADLEGKLLTAE
jgi:DNA invertase Pin-like site-specific DNA recombinase